jgi:hypothetical protein
MMLCNGLIEIRFFYNADILYYNGSFLSFKWSFFLLILLFIMIQMLINEGWCDWIHGLAESILVWRQWLFDILL